MKTTITLALAMLVGLASANLLVNGDFEQTMDVGWDTIAVNSAGGDTFTWSDTLGQPSPGHAVAVRKYLARYASMHQTIDIPDVYLTLSFDGRLRIGGGSSTCWPVAAFVVRYLDSSEASLGNTKLYLHDQYCDWLQSDTQSLIEVTTPGIWTPFSIDIADELSKNLSGIDAANVKKLTIDLYAYDNGT
jgi:uncharacterized protein (DUF779 family)